MHAVPSALSATALQWDVDTFRMQGGSAVTTVTKDQFQVDRARGDATFAAELSCPPFTKALMHVWSLHIDNLIDDYGLNGAELSLRSTAGETLAVLNSQEFAPSSPCRVTCMLHSHATSTSLRVYVHAPRGAEPRTRPSHRDKGAGFLAPSDQWLQTQASENWWAFETHLPGAAADTLQFSVQTSGLGTSFSLVPLPTP